MDKPHKIIWLLSLLVVMEFIAIICLCRRSERLGENNSGLKKTTELKDRRTDAFLGDISGEQYIHVTGGGVKSVGIDSCFFFDITGDAVPEIWLLTEGSEADRLVLVYSLSDWGRELYLGTAGHSEFYDGRRYVLRQEAHMGYAHWYKLCWNGKTMVSEQVFEEFTCGDYTVPREKRFEETQPEDLDPNELIKWIL